MKKLALYILTIAMILGSTIGYSQNSDTGIQSYFELAVKENPELKSAYLQYLAALEKVPQLGSLPDPETSIGFFLKPMELLGGNQLANVQIMQMFPWFGTLKTARDEASMMAQARYESFNMLKAELYYNLKSSAYQIMKLQEEINQVKENIVLLESLEKIALIKFSSPAINGGPAMSSSSGMSSSNTQMNTPNGGMNGMKSATTANNQKLTSGASSSMTSGMSQKDSGLPNVLRVKMEILDQQNRLKTLFQLKKTEEAAFNVLINRPLESPVNLPDSLKVVTLKMSIQSIADTILASNPMLAMLEKEGNAYKLMEIKADKMGLPMMGLGINYILIQERAGNTAMMNGNDMIMPMVSFTMPIYRKKYRAMQNEARLMQQANDQQISDYSNRLMLSHRRFIQDLDDADRRLALYTEQKNLAKKTLELLLADFSSSGTDYEEVLRMQSKVLDYEFKYIEAIVDYNMAIALAEKLMNSTEF
jgi:outer membrane protein TolC